MKQKQLWLDWAVELQALAQAGLFYGKDVFDRERYQRIREISAQMIAHQADIPLPRAMDLFCCEIGYQTPKIDTRAAVFQNDRILLVQERNGKWSLPGGWCDVHISPAENAVKEVKEEAGLDVTAELLIAVQDRDKHNLPVYAYKICKMFFLCTATGGSFEENAETTDAQYFSINSLPPLAEEKNTADQIKLCFEAYHSEHWFTVFD